MRGIPLSARGFTLIELMVVVTIIGMLMSMLFPAAQVAREGGRKVVCEGNLRNLSQAVFGFMARDADRQMFPSGGWGSRWVGNPNLSAENQPGGWAYQILPYIEQGGLYNMGIGTADMSSFNARRLGVVMPLFICPSRRIPALFPFVRNGRNPPSKPTMDFADAAFADFTTLDLVARGDYAMNAGDQPLCYSPASTGGTFEDDGPPTLAAGIDPGWWNNINNTTKYEMRPPITPDYDPINPRNFEPSGVSFRRGNIIRDGQNQLTFDKLLGVNVSMVDGPKGDGRAYVYLIGEKCMDALRYNTGFDEGDDDALYSGYGNDNYRTAYGPPARDVQEQEVDPILSLGRRCRFGSAHPYGTHFVFCDGRIKSISYVIHPLVHAKLANRSDNLLPNLVPQIAPHPSGVFKGVIWTPRALETSFPAPNPNDNEY